MNSALLQFATWLAEQPISIGLHESFYLYNWIETTHVMTLMVSLGMLAVIDLRLLGVAFANVPASTIAQRLDKPMLIGFAVMLITGVLLYTAIPVRTTQSLWFRIKMLLLVAACVNAWLFRREMAAASQTWDLAPPPRRMRIAGGLSLALWAGVILTGRFIAYDWFDCGGDNPAFVDWAAGCLAATP